MLSYVKKIEITIKLTILEQYIKKIIIYPLKYGFHLMLNVTLWYFMVKFTFKKKKTYKIQHNDITCNNITFYKYFSHISHIHHPDECDEL